MRNECIPPTIPAAILPGRHRVHHTYIWLSGIQSAIILLVALGVSMFGTVSSMIASESAEMVALSLLLVAGGSLLIAIVCVGGATLFQWLSWKNLSYEISPTEFSLNYGIISKKRQHVPYQRIQAVNQQAGLLQRIAGVCTVKLDTAGGSANSGLNVPYIKNSDAEALRAELFRRKKVLLAGGSFDEQGNAYMPDGSCIPLFAPVFAGSVACPGQCAVAGRSQGVAQAQAPESPLADAIDDAVAAAERGNVLDAPNELWHDMRGVFGGVEQDTGAVRYEVGLSNRELVLAGVSGASSGMGLAILGAIGVLGSALSFAGPFAESVLAETTGVAEVSFEEIGPLLMGFALPIAGIVVAVIAGIWLFSLVGTLVRYGGFRARRRENRIEVEYGLLQHSFHGVDIDRVQSVIIKQSLIRRLMGYCEVSLGKIESASTQNDGSQQQTLSGQGVVIHPFVKIDRVPELLAGLAPEFADVPAADVRPARCALRRAIVRSAMIRSASFWGIFAVAAAQVAVWFALGQSTLPAEDAAALAMVAAYLPMYYILALLMLVINAGRAVLWYYGSSFAYNERYMRVVNAGYSTESVMFPRRKIQYAALIANPFQRHAGVCIVEAVTAAGIGGSRERIWDIDELEAERWMEWVRPRR